MSYQVFARKYRPQVFEDVVAQEHITKTLANALRSGRVAHAYLFTGPRGVGKTTTARILAKALNCERGPTPTPCDVCPSCREITEGKSLDVLEIDGASNNGVEEIRRLRERVGLSASQERRRKIYIIDEVHMLSTSAFNALLKTLEEPPPHVLFVFATTESHKVPATITSRCQRFDFRRVPTQRIVEQLKSISEREGIIAEENALFLIARAADGAMRDAEGLLDQVLAFGDGKIVVETVRDVLGLIDRDLYFDLTEAILKKDIHQGIEITGRMIDSGGDIGELCIGLMEHFRHLLFAKVEGLSEQIEVSQEDRLRYRELAGRLSEGDLLRLIKIVSDVEQVIGRSANPRLRLEVAIVRLVTMEPTILLTELIEQVRAVPSHSRAEDRRERHPLPHGMPVRSSDVAVPTTQPPISHSKNSLSADKEGEEDPTPSYRKADLLKRQELTLESIREGWTLTIEDIKQEQISLGTFLSAGHPEQFNGSTLSLAFDREHSFHAGEVFRKRRTVEDLLSHIFKQRMSIECRVEDGTPLVNGKVVKSSQFDPDEATLKKVVQVFDGELIKG
jgi:DNA polymerase-3 subunit gamma/tau